LCDVLDEVTSSGASNILVIADAPADVTTRRFIEAGKR